MQRMNEGWHLLAVVHLLRCYCILAFIVWEDWLHMIFGSTVQYQHSGVYKTDVRIYEIEHLPSWDYQVILLLKHPLYKEMGIKNKHIFNPPHKIAITASFSGCPPLPCDQSSSIV